MNLPTNTELPFFAYGLFRKGQISHFRIKSEISKIKANYSINGLLRIRDGITIIDATITDRKVIGDLIFFDEDKSKIAYESICLLEPKKYYKWSEIQTDFGKANLLVGVKPHLGSVEDLDSWDSWSDPLFTVSFELIEEAISNSDKDDFWSGKQFLRLQMAYLLLWSSIERFVALRYNFRGDHIIQNITNLTKEPKFKELILRCNEKRVLYSSDNVENKIKFDKNDSLMCIKYYYQIRSNITHRGKASIQDVKLVKECLIELKRIFEKIIDDAKNESRQ